MSDKGTYKVLAIQVMIGPGVNKVKMPADSRPLGFAVVGGRAVLHVLANTETEDVVHELIAVRTDEEIGAFAMRKPAREIDPDDARYIGSILYREWGDRALHVFALPRKAADVVPIKTPPPVGA